LDFLRRVLCRVFLQIDSIKLQLVTKNRGKPTRHETQHTRWRVAYTANRQHIVKCRPRTAFLSVGNKQNFQLRP